jgi:DnaJ-class molecular chaperone
VATEDETQGRECMACRATGKVVSTAGGERREVDCPWCDGAGRWIPEHDAQARWRDGDGGDGEPPPAAA